MEAYKRRYRALDLAYMDLLLGQRIKPEQYSKFTQFKMYFEHCLKPQMNDMAPEFFQKCINDLHVAWITVDENELWRVFWDMNDRIRNYIEERQIACNNT
jgi:hypothetical protein